MQIFVDNAPIYVQKNGSGQIILFLHGNPDSGDLWQPVMAQMSGDYECIAPDLPGFGRSAVPANFDCSLESMASFVDNLVKELSLELPIYLVGHDFGGIFALAWAIRHPEKVQKLAIGSCPFFSDYRWHFWGRIWRTPLLGEISAALMNYPVFRWEVRRGSRRLSDSQLRQAYRHVTPAMKEMVLQLYRATTPANFLPWEQELPKLTAKVPTIVLWGEDDPYISVKYAERFHAEKVYRFPNCGHWFPGEMPEETATILANFFTNA